MGESVARMEELPPPGSTPAASSDLELIERARRGSESAFRELVERYEPRVAATVIGMLGAGDEAEDAGQEVFIRLYRSLDRFRGEAGLGTYLTRIAVNVSLTALKRRKRSLLRFVRGADGEPEPAAEAEGPAERTERRERMDAVRRALDRLRPEQRAVVTLRLLQGYSTRETARILNVPEGTVMSRLSRALDRLRSELEGVYE